MGSNRIMDAEPVNTIICPHCEAHLDSNDDLCTHCGSSTFVGQHPYSQAMATTPAVDSQGVDTQTQFLNQAWVQILLILHLGILGSHLYWKTNYSRPVRVLMIVVAALYTLLALWVFYYAWTQIRYGWQAVFG